MEEINMARYTANNSPNIAIFPLEMTVKVYHFKSSIQNNMLQINVLTQQ